MDPDRDGNVFRATIMESIKGFDDDMERNPTRIKFCCSINKNEYTDLIAYNEVADYITRDNSQTTFWEFEEIVSNQGPLTMDHKDYNGSTYNVQIQWSTGEIITEPLTIIAKDNPVVCALYAKDHGLLDKPGWKQFKKIANWHKKLICHVNQAKLWSYHSTPKNIFGYQIPQDYAEAVKLDEANGNTKWQDCTALEMIQLKEYKTFQDLGHSHRTRILQDKRKSTYISCMQWNTMDTIKQD